MSYWFLEKSTKTSPYQSYLTIKRSRNASHAGFQTSPLIRRNKPFLFSAFTDILISLLDTFADVFFERPIRFNDIKTVAV